MKKVEKLSLSIIFQIEAMKKETERRFDAQRGCAID
jgi:hypothetical protein